MRRNRNNEDSRKRKLAAKFPMKVTSVEGMRSEGITTG